MRRFRRNAQIGAGVGLVYVAALALGLVPPVSTFVRAQSRPPLQEPIALEGTMKQFYRGLNVMIVTTKDGVEHIYHFTKDLIVHGGKKPSVDALEGLREGTTVVIHYSNDEAVALAQEVDVVGDEGLKIAEGVVADINRGKKEITITFANGETDTLQMTSRAAAESEAAALGGKATKIVVYYSDESGQKVAHYFKRVP